jgi:hypothetical protein
MRLLAIAAVSALLLIDAKTVSADSRVETFYGAWCENQPGYVDEHIIIKKDFFSIADSTCEEVKMWMHGKSLRVSASCHDEESQGFIAFTGDFELKDRDTLVYRHHNLTLKKAWCPKR